MRGVPGKMESLISLQRGNFSGTESKQKHFIYGFKLGMVTITAILQCLTYRDVSIKCS